ncbi:cirrhosis, autosomal recessive 1A (cirhin) [Perkinsus olseni]|uniref:Cirrhosis, autosomal recessive 1A (Cirhin) n=1 Tax=Perkinsus olseni TaxID=32597 RepID=A0A7J6NZI8_PEROL|nr:cirrhosis, autosomal recessive 1A (cirhin) [Perkinsus olseni]
MVDVVVVQAVVVVVLAVVGSGEGRRFDRYSLGPSGSTTLTRLGELKGEYQAAKKKKGGGSSSATSRALSVCFGTVSKGRDDGNYRTIFSGNDRGVVSEWRVEVKEGDDGSTEGEGNDNGTRI